MRSLTKLVEVNPRQITGYDDAVMVSVNDTVLVITSAAIAKKFKSFYRGKWHDDFTIDMTSTGVFQSIVLKHKDSGKRFDLTPLEWM